MHVDSKTDYRLRLLEKATTWFDSHDAEDRTPALVSLFEAMAGEPGAVDATLTLNHRRLHAKRHAGDVIWFPFKELCDGPRGQADYIEIARCYHTVFVSDIPTLDVQSENQARRFITMIDEFYDRAVKVIVSAEKPVTDLYHGTKLKFEFERTQSSFDRDAVAGISGATASALMRPRSNLSGGGHERLRVDGQQPKSARQRHRPLRHELRLA